MNEYIGIQEINGEYYTVFLPDGYERDVSKYNGKSDSELATKIEELIVAAEGLRVEMESVNAEIDEIQYTLVLRSGAFDEPDFDWQSASAKWRQLTYKALDSTYDLQCQEIDKVIIVSFANHDINRDDFLAIADGWGQLKTPRVYVYQESLIEVSEGQIAIYFCPPHPNPVRISISLPLRRQVYERDGYLCRYCETLTYHNPNDQYSGIKRTIDHVMPWSAGGTNEPENLVTACRRCNFLAGSRVFKNFAAKKEWILSQLAQEGENATT